MLPQNTKLQPCCRIQATMIPLSVFKDDAILAYLAGFNTVSASPPGGTLVAVIPLGFLL